MKIELIDETQAKMAVLRTTYHACVSKVDFLHKIEETTHIPLGEADLAWEILDYMEWENEDAA
jgi:hypothetical protein